MLRFIRIKLKLLTFVMATVRHDDKVRAELANVPRWTFL